MTLASCDSRKTAGENPFFTEWDTPHGVPPFDKILPEHFMPAFERGMSLHEAEIDAITSNKDEATFENTILAYDDAGQMLAQTELVFGMLCAAETNDRMQALQEQAMPLLAAHRDKIRLDDKLFVRVKEVYDRRAALGLDAEQMRLLQKTYDSFVRAGALLDAEQKARLKEINGQLSLTAVKFGITSSPKTTISCSNSSRTNSTGCRQASATPPARRPGRWARATSGSSRSTSPA